MKRQTPPLFRLEKELQLARFARVLANIYEIQERAEPPRHVDVYGPADLPRRTKAVTWRWVKMGQKMLFEGRKEEGGVCRKLAGYPH